MNGKFTIGVGLGMAAGAAAALMIKSECCGKPSRSKVGRCLKSMGDIIESITDAIGI